MQKKPRIRGRPRRGFTLAELVMTMAILGTIGGVLATERLENVTGTRAQLATHKMASDIRFAQMTAIQTQSRTRVSFNTAGPNQTMSLFTETSPGTWTALQNPLTKTPYVLDFNSGDYTGVVLTLVSFNGGSHLVFDSLGRPFDLSGTALNDSVVQVNAQYNLQCKSQTGKILFHVSSE